MMNEIFWGTPVKYENNVTIGCSSIRLDNNGIMVPQTGSIIIGNEVHIGAGSTIAWGENGDSPTVIGDYVCIGPLVSIAHGAVIHDNVALLSGCRIAGFVDIGENALIGMGACIKNRVNIGENAVIGIGAVVTKDVPSGEIWTGVPARFYKKVDK